ncbi:MAG TPA: wax ester/triacylglycerol synthase family O-acyltransferase [Thermoanaerobaculia bacterium]|nr:wax ester/triacylglycerol synthase family O-acyltransferase [Thermoanaerobaculia bacterium]
MTDPTPQAAENPGGLPPLPTALPDLPAVPLRSVDYAWLRMDEPANLMIINGVLAFEGPLDADRVREVVRERLVSIDRFRNRVVQPQRGVWPVWQPSPDFDLDDHLVVETLDAPGDDDALADLVGRHMGQPLDPTKPPWVFYLIQGYDGGSALFARLHHCLGDGIALMLVLLSLTDLVAEHPAAEEGDDNPFRALFAKAKHDLEAVREATERVMPEGMKLLLHPARALKEAGRFLTGVAATDALGRLLFRSRDPSTKFKGPLTIDKLAAWSRSMPLADVRAVAAAAGGSVTDVLSTAAAGGLRRYLLDHGDTPADLQFRAAVPVNLRPLGEMAQLGNRFGLVFLSLPVGIADPLERIAEVRRRMRQLKRSAEPVVTYGILTAMGRSPKLVQQAVVKLIASKTTAVLTSVPGPQQPLYLAGRRIRDVFFWVPQAGRVGLGLSICSYAGQVRLGVATDAGLVPDPERIVEGFHEEFDDLRRRSG